MGFSSSGRAATHHMEQRTRNIYVNSANANFVDNSVHTFKYTPWTFLPLFLKQQFSKPSNCFFLSIACLQQIKDLSPTGRYGTIFPLSFILLVSAAKEIYEDRKRRQADEAVNYSRVETFVDGSFQHVYWESVRVGQVVRLSRNECVPADLALLSTSEPEGFCYLETANIDGESNLKIRQARNETAWIRNEIDLQGFRGFLECAPPSDQIYGFEGGYDIMAPRTYRVPLHMDQFLPRGSVIKNTGWVIGVIVYSGHETKIMHCAIVAPIKRSKMDQLTDSQSLWIVLGLLTMTILAVVINHFLALHVMPSHHYLHFSLPNTVWGLVWYYLSMFFSFLLLLNNLVPISLSITLETVRVMLAQLIDNDREMYDEETDTPAVAKSSGVVDTLGQVEYVLTDKTGTLTRNKMVLRHVVVNGHIFYNCQDPSSLLRQNISSLSHSSQDLSLAGTSSQSSDGQTDLFMSMLSLCHTVMIDHSSGGPIFQASSPDELAIVQAASVLDYRFQSRSGIQITVRANGLAREYDVLAVIEFTSTRKRMSTVLRDPSGHCFLFCKGADGPIFEGLKPSNQHAESTRATLKALDEFAVEGLRTLCFAYRELDPEECAIWLETWTAATNSTSARQEAIDSAAELIERDLVLLGATGVEDRLQEGVPETISSLILANIKVWMLTGDRLETAVNTGYLSGLLNASCRQIILRGDTFFELLDQLKSSEVSFEANPSLVAAMLVDGKTMSVLLDGALDCDFHAGLGQSALRDSVIKRFTDIAARCRCLICYRLSPLQKSQIALLVRDRMRKVTLAIGDGGNDVGMIQSADVGVGISGLEGLQASRAADFAIARFQFLQRLLLVHGSWSLHRLSRTVLYTMYKNITLFLGQYLFACFSLFTARSLMASWMLMLYNVVFTVLPPGLIGVTDQFVRASELVRNPQLYRFGQQGRFYNTKLFWGSVANAILHTFIIFACVRLWAADGLAFGDGRVVELQTIGSLYFILTLVVVSLKVILFTNFYTYLLMAACIAGSLAWLLLFIAFNSIQHTGDLAWHLLASPMFWAALVTVPALTTCRDFLWRFYRRQFRPHPYHIVQEMNAIELRTQKRQKKEAASDQQATAVGRGFSFAQTPGQTRVLQAYGHIK